MTNQSIQMSKFKNICDLNEICFQIHICMHNVNIKYEDGGNQIHSKAFVHSCF